MILYMSNGPFRDGDLTSRNLSRRRDKARRSRTAFPATEQRGFVALRRGGFGIRAPTFRRFQKIYSSRPSSR
ncbi:hypothetical protein, partial [Cryobacterium sp. Hh11]|uniref:hypothetical protein n=1 Tax=Cryobacterium sp. Hh11 TaxID=2555868 RepID=UPI001A7F066D